MEDDEVMAEVQCTFRTALPELYQVEESEIQLPTQSSNKDLSEVVKQLLEDEGRIDEKDL